MSQIYNPYLPLWEHVPDGEPHLFEGRVYVYGSHDKADGKDYCEDHYVVWSAPEKDLTNWKYEGVAYRRNQDPDNADDTMQLFAPDVCRGRDGRYYLYYCLNGSSRIGVAVSDGPAGPFEYYGHVKRPDGSVYEDAAAFDPAVLCDEDGRTWLYIGFAPSDQLKKKLNPADFCDSSLVAEVEEDMLTLKADFKDLIPGEKLAAGTGFEGHGFFEASSIRKFEGSYYFVYSSVLSHELCYAVSNRPDGGFTFGGTLISNGDIGLRGRTQAVACLGHNHGSLLWANGKYYIFYHRQTNGTEYSRQGMAEQIDMRPDGGFDQTETTSCGLNGGALYASGSYPAAICCNLRCEKSIDRIDFGDLSMREQAAVTEYANEVYVKQIENKTVLGYKYFAFLGASMITVEIRGAFDGDIIVSTDMEGEEVIGEAEVHIQSGDWGCELIPLDELSGTHALYFTFEGKGTLDMKSFAFLAM